MKLGSNVWLLIIVKNGQLLLSFPISLCYGPEMFIVVVPRVVVFVVYVM